MRYGLDKSPTLQETRICHWCGNSLRHLRNLYKGKDCERWYCSEKHLISGEELALRRKVKAAGEVS